MGLSRERRISRVHGKKIVNCKYWSLLTKDTYSVKDSSDSLGTSVLPLHYITSYRIQKFINTSNLSVRFVVGIV